MKKFFSQPTEQKGRSVKYTDERLKKLDEVFSRFCEDNLTERESHNFDHLLGTEKQFENLNVNQTIQGSIKR